MTQMRLAGPNGSVPVPLPPPEPKPPKPVNPCPNVDKRYAKATGLELKKWTAAYDGIGPTFKVFVVGKVDRGPLRRDVTLGFIAPSESRACDVRSYKTRDKAISAALQATNGAKELQHAQAAMAVVRQKDGSYILGRTIYAQSTSSWTGGDHGFHPYGFGDLSHVRGLTFASPNVVAYVDNGRVAKNPDAVK